MATKETLRMKAARLRDEGCTLAETVARLEPAGPETEALRRLRRALEAGRGEEPAQGIVTVQWETESEATP